MTSYDIFLNPSEWPLLVDFLTDILITPGLAGQDEWSRKHTWHLSAADLIAFEQHDFEDDHNIAFSSYTSWILLNVHRTLPHQEADDYGRAFGILLLHHLRSRFDPAAILVRDIQREIIV